ncbi:MAG: L,D-transpeptidase [Methylococcaceae bacterium]|nr:L,D-transpeptidase [Methylococcaceae bacterium]
MVWLNYSAFTKPLCLTAVLSVLLALVVPAHAGEEIWLLVDTKSKVIRVKQGQETKAEYKHISIGRNGVASDKVRGDNKTPLGIYRIGWLNPNSQFHRFYGFNYPSRVDAARGLRKGLIDTKTYQRLFDADVLDRIPDQTTRLGGQIGIHGLGSADPEIHKALDWTRGCIALTNNQINSLGIWIKKGTVVVIR